MPRLVRLYIVHILGGFALSTAFVGLLLWQNIGNLAHLIGSSDAGLLALALLWLFNGLVFSGAQFAIAVMRMQDDGTPPRGGKRAAQPRLQPVAVPARTTKGAQGIPRQLRRR